MRNKVKVFTTTKMVLFTGAVGIMMSKMEKELNIGPTDATTKVSTRMVLSMGKESSIGRMERSTRESLDLEKSKALEYTNGQTSVGMKVNGKPISCMVKESFIGQMGKSTRVITSMERKKEVDWWCFLMVDLIRENGVMERNMVVAWLLTPRAINLVLSLLAVSR